MNTPTLEDLLRMVRDPNVEDDEVAEASRRWAEANNIHDLVESMDKPSH